MRTQTAGFQITNLAAYRAKNQPKPTIPIVVVDLEPARSLPEAPQETILEAPRRETSTRKEFALWVDQASRTFLMLLSGLMLGTAMIIFVAGAAWLVGNVLRLPDIAPWVGLYESLVGPAKYLPVGIPMAILAITSFGCRRLNRR